MKNDKGVTLVELLVVIVLMSIVSVAAYNFLNTTLKTNQTISEKVNLNQEANLILSIIQKEFYTHSKLSFENRDHIIYLKAGTNEIPLNDSYIEFETFKVKDTLVEDGTSAIDIPTDNENFDISFVISSTSSSEQFEIKTTLYKK